MMNYRPFMVTVGLSSRGGGGGGGGGLEGFLFVSDGGILLSTTS